MATNQTPTPRARQRAAKRAALREWLEEHDGVIRTRTLGDLGFTKRQIDGMVVRGELIRERHGVYRGRGVRWDLRAQLREALDAHGESARLVLVSSLHWQGLLSRPADRPQVGIPGTGDTARLGQRTVYRTPYARTDAVEHQGLMCSAPIDALPHLAGLVRGEAAPRRMLRRAIREAIRKDHRMLPRLQAVAAERFPGALELRAALATVPGAKVVRSDLEEDFIAFCEIWGLPPFLMNQKVGGVERDAVRPDEHLIVELDTRGYHGNLIAMERDRVRRRRATVAGWRHLEITGLDLSVEPSRVAADLASLLGIKDYAPPHDAAERWKQVLIDARGLWLPA